MSTRQIETIIKNVPITHIDLDMTNNCILECDYCFRGKKNKQSLSWEVGIKAIDFLIQHSQNAKFLVISLFGGEPLLEFKLIKKLVPYAKQKAAYYGKKIHFSATTNCVLVNDEIIQFFRRYGMSFLTSIDGDAKSHDKHRHFSDGTGSLAIIVPKIKKILEYQPNTSARATVSNDTVHRLFKDVFFLVDIGYSILAMQPVIEVDWTEEQFECLRRELRKISNFYIERFRIGKPLDIKHIEDSLRGIVNPSRQRNPCAAGRSSVLVKTDGTIYPCHRFGGAIDAYSDKRWKLGSIFDGIDYEKRGPLLNFDSISQAKADCENCLAVHTCRFGCMAVSWYCFQDIYKPHPNECKFRNMCFSEAIRIHYILSSENNQAFINRFYAHSHEGQNRKRMQNLIVA